MNSKLLYIGLNGLAGSGKDTVAKMLKTILMQDWESLDECKTYYKSKYTNPTISATLNNEQEDRTLPVMCIAYADQLKYICANIFGIPVERFYMNKSNAWICVNHDFQYTELRPEDNIVTSDEYYYNQDSYSKSDNKVWMSLRDVLVYVGTYVLQLNINKSIFVNIVRNKINEISRVNHNLKYVIVTDNRFYHEMSFIREENNGITLKIVRNGVKQLNNIAEHELDDEDNYDYIIDNNAGYDELFEQIWDIVHTDLEFANKTISLNTRDNVDNYLRLIDNDNDSSVFMLCAPLKIQKVYHNDGDITMLDPIGGPIICVGKELDCSNNTIDEDLYTIIPKKIEFDDITNKFLIYT